MSCRALVSQLALTTLLLGSFPVPPSPEEEEELQEHQVKCLNNCAAAQLKLQLFEEVLASCSAILHIDPDNVKALYRKGKVQPSTHTKGTQETGAWPGRRGKRLVGDGGEGED